MDEKLERLNGSQEAAEEMVDVADDDDVWPKTLELICPVPLTPRDGSPMVSELVLSEPCAGNFVGLPIDKPIDAALALAHRLSGQPLSVIHKLKHRDCRALMGVVLPLLASFLGISPTSLR